MNAKSSALHLPGWQVKNLFMPFIFCIFLIIVLTRLSFAIRSIVLHRKNNLAVRSALAAVPRQRRW